MGLNKLLKILLPVLLVSGLLMAGCGGESTPNPWIGKPAPDFQFQNLEGQNTSLSDLKGSLVFINFWAVRCPPCRSEMPFIQQIYDEWQGRGLVLLAINIGESPSQIEEFMQSSALHFPVLLDTDGSIARQYSVMAIPTSFFIDKNGIIQAWRVGAFSSKEEVESVLAKIVP